MKKLIKILFISCRKATELIEKKMNSGLSISERIQLRMHKMICDACTQYEKQSLYIDKGFNSMINKSSVDSDLDNLIKKIHSKLNDSGN